MYEQATIPIEKEHEFQQLRGAIDKVFSPPLDTKFLASVKSAGMNIRQFDRVLAGRLIDKAYPQVGSAGALYESLPVTDQGQLREFYLERLERVPEEWRRKFHTVYRLA